MGVANGDQAISSQDEGDIGQRRRVGVSLPEQRGGHEDGVVFDIETGGRLDILEVVAGRDLDAENLLDIEFLIAGRLDHVDPDDILGKGGGMRQIADLNRPAIGTVSGNHRSSLRLHPTLKAGMRVVLNRIAVPNPSIDKITPNLQAGRPLRNEDSRH